MVSALKATISLILFLGILTGCANFQNYALPQKFTIKKLWARPALSEVNPGFFKNHVAQPVVIGKNILVANGYDGVGLYRQSNGRKVWKFYIKNGSEAKPLVEGGSIFIGGSDGLFYSIGAKNGLLNWSFPIRFEGLGSPVIDDKSVYFSTGNHSLYSLDTKTGKSNWTYIRKVDSPISVRGQGEVLVHNDRVYTGFSDGYFVAFKKSTGTIIWEKKLNSNRRFKDIDSSPVLFGDAIYVSGYDSNLYALDKASGNILWQSPYGSHTKVLLKNDTLFASTSSGEVVALNKSTGKLLWKVKLKNGIGTSPTYFKGYLVIGESDGKLLVLSQLNGEIISSYDTGAGVKAKVTLLNDSKQFFALSAGGNIFSFNMGLKKASYIWPWED